MRYWKGYIYIIKAKNDLYKIGRATHIEQRIKRLPFSVELIHSISADNVLQAERTLHERYRKSLIGGEWFRLSAEEIAELKRLVYIPEFKDGKSRCVTVNNLSQDITDSLNSQTAHLGFKSRERYLRILLIMIAQSPLAVIEEAIELGTIDPLVEAAAIKPR